MLSLLLHTLCIIFLLLRLPCIFIFKRRARLPVMLQELGEKQAYTLMAAVSLLVFVILGAVEVVLNGVFWGSLGCICHAVFHEPNPVPLYDPLATAVSSTLTGELSDTVIDLEAATLLPTITREEVKVADF